MDGKRDLSVNFSVMIEKIFELTFILGMNFSCRNDGYEEMEIWESCNKNGNSEF